MNKILCLCVLYGVAFPVMASENCNIFNPDTGEMTAGSWGVVNLAMASEDCNFPAIFNFGDSNSDTGGMTASSLLELTAHYGKSFFKRPSGRVSDGRLITDFMAEHLGLQSLGAYLDALGTNFSNGVNFAASSATIRLPNSVIPKGMFSPFYLEVQLMQFTQFKRRSQMIRRIGGVFASLMPKEEYFSEALYTFDIGQNDITDGLLSGLTIQQVNASVPDIVDSFSTYFKNIYKASGGRSFWIHNTGPIGCLPFLFMNFPSEQDDAGCSKPLNEVSQHLNVKLKEAVVQLRKDLPEASITYVDVYTPKYSLFLHPEQYGLEDPLVICCGYGGGRYNYSAVIGCGRTGTVDGSLITGGACEDPSVRVSWDGMHYTEAANRFIFNQISTGAFSDPPVPLKRACNAGRLGASNSN